mmetsp:Transcript_13545/g.33250  ORF Transcript_13545/g.33250 Transcript_13545/m.33250 type:complete len:228 (-) Transcript_13545:1143-1826(-)
MAAALRHAPLGQHQDHIGVHDGGQAVRHNDRGHARPDGRQAGVDLLLRDGVERAGGLVQDQDGRLLQHRACKRDALFLAAAQPDAALAHARVVPLLEVGGDGVVDVRHSRRLRHLLVAGAWRAVLDVVAHRLVEQHAVLRHHADGAPHRRQRGGPDVLPVDEHTALPGVVEAQQQLEDGGLAAASGTHHGQRLAARHMEGHALEHRLTTRVVPKHHVLEVHRARTHA